MNSQNQLWKVEALVEPKIEWERLGIDSFKIGTDEAITLDKQHENKTQFSITVISSGNIEAHHRAELLMKSFLAPLELEARRNYRSVVTHIRPVYPRPTKNGRVLLDSIYVGAIQVVPKLEDLDLSLLKMVSSSLKMLDIDKRERVLGVLNFLYDGLAASTDAQAYLTIYGGLNYLTSATGKEANTLLSDAMTLFKFIRGGILDPDTAIAWMEKLHNIHANHYNVSKGNRVAKQELDDVKAFFKKFLMKYIEYAKSGEDKEEC